MMYKISKLFFVVFLMTISYNVLLCQATKESVYSELVNIYKHVTTISFNFHQIEENMKGSITAKEGNKYKMVLEERIIVCNGKTIWNYVPKDNKVVISNYEEIGDQVSLESLFFSFLDDFKPVKLEEANTSEGVTAYVLTLKVKDNSKNFKSISTVQVWVNKGTYDIIQFHITEPHKMTWLIDRLRLRRHSENSIFEFSPQKDCKIIDLRE
jgi:outer membrane lipoprotein carrier protein